MPTAIQNVPVTQIKAWDNDRKTFDRAKLQELADSIAAQGLAQPITVRPAKDGGYHIAAGERRYRAVSQILGWETIPAIVREMNDEELEALMLVENTGRADLNPIEEGEAYQRRADRYGWADKKIAQIAGKSAELVTRRRNLLTLHPDIKHLVARGHMPIGHAEALTPLDHNRQMIALRIFRDAKAGVPLSTFKGIVSQLLEKQSQESLFDLAEFWSNRLEQTLELPRSGKKAVTGAPASTDAPVIKTTNKDTVGSIFDRYISDLLTAGKTAEAATVGNLYNSLVHSNFTSVPADAKLLS